MYESKRKQEMLLKDHVFLSSIQPLIGLEDPTTRAYSRPTKSQPSSPAIALKQVFSHICFHKITFFSVNTIKFKW